MNSTIEIIFKTLSKVETCDDSSKYLASLSKAGKEILSPIKKDTHLEKPITIK